MVNQEAKLVLNINSPNLPIMNRIFILLSFVFWVCNVQAQQNMMKFMQRANKGMVLPQRQQKKDNAISEEKTSTKEDLPDTDNCVFEGKYIDYELECEDCEDYEDYDNSLLTMQYVNWGTEDNPEIVWLIKLESEEGDELEESFWFSNKSTYSYESKSAVFKDSNEELRNDIYTLKPAGKDSNLIEISTYGSYIGINGIKTDRFQPYYMLIRVFYKNGTLRYTMLIPYNGITKKKIYESLTKAISKIGIKKIG